MGVLGGICKACVRLYAGLGATSSADEFVLTEMILSTDFNRVKVCPAILMPGAVLLGRLTRGHIEYSNGSCRGVQTVAGRPDEGIQASRHASKIKRNVV